MGALDAKLTRLTLRLVAVLLATVTAAVLASSAAAASHTGAAGPAAVTAAATPTPAPPPANDDRDNAQALGALPATVSGTTVGSTLETDEPNGECNDLAGSVWYSVSFGATVPAVTGVSLSAGGQLDACVDVFTKQRSQDIFDTGGETDTKGLGRLTFTPTANTTYLIRVGQLFNSDAGPFSLEVFGVVASASAPGIPLPASGALGSLDSFFTTTAAYSMPLTAAVTYKVNLVNRAGGCMPLSIYAPGTTDFSSAQPVRRSCSSYRLFTPMQTGRYSFLIQAARGLDVKQPFALHVEAASNQEMAPGIALGNLSTVHSLLRGNVDDVVRLYRLDVTSRSELTLQLNDHNSASSFDLELLTSKGREVDCECGSTGDQTIQEITRPGIYYAAVKAEGFSSGRFTLSRQSRTVTRLRVAIDGHGATHTPAGTIVQVSARISPAVTGDVTFELEYFDPVSGWQFRGNETEPLIAGVAGFAFTPPEPGRWRTTAAFAGTRTAAPAVAGYANLNEIPLADD